MQIQLYNFSKRTNSTKLPTGSGEVRNVNLKDGTSIFTPVFIINDFDISFNYLKWDNRYYFINDIEFLRMNIYSVSCTIDVLATYRTAIFNTSAFVLYSSSRYNRQLLDSRLRSDPAAIYSSTAAQLITDGVSVDNNFYGGTYITNYVTQQATFGPAGLLWLTRSAAQNLAQMLTDTNFLNLENFEKQFTNAYQALISVRYVPFSWRRSGRGAATVYLGSYNTNITGSLIQQAKSYSTTIQIPYLFSDFRNAYTSYLLYLPAYGFTQINRQDIRGRSSLSIKLDIDGVTGQGTYIVDDLGRYSCNFACDVSIGTVSGNAGMVVSSALQIGTAYAMGNNLGMLTGAISGRQALLTRNVGNVGSQGGLSAAFATPGRSWTSVYMIAIGHNTTVEPSTITATQGRPLNAIRRLGDLSGYVQTNERSVAAVNSDISNQINTLLNGGVYIE